MYFFKVLKMGMCFGTITTQVTATRGPVCFQMEHIAKTQRYTIAAGIV